jgi:hypothetical protein
VTMTKRTTADIGIPEGEKPTHSTDRLGAPQSGKWTSGESLKLPAERLTLVKLSLKAPR